MSELPAIILAGGRALRMGGGDKGLLRLGGHSLIGHVIARLGPQCSCLAISANGDPDRFAGFGLPVLADSLPDRPGPLAGVLAGMDWAGGQGAAAVVSVAADTPFLPGDLVARLAASAGRLGCAVAASVDAGGAVHDHPVIALWPVALRGALRASLEKGERRVGGFLDLHHPGRASWPATPHDPFFNVNRPDDMARARRIATEL